MSNIGSQQLGFEPFALILRGLAPDINQLWGVFSGDFNHKLNAILLPISLNFGYILNLVFLVGQVVNDLRQINDTNNPHLVVSFNFLNSWELTIAPLLPIKYSPLQLNGNGNQVYLCSISEELAILLAHLTGDGLKNLKQLSEDSEQDRNLALKIQREHHIGETEALQIV